MRCDCPEDRHDACLGSLGHSHPLHNCSGMFMFSCCSLLIKNDRLRTAKSHKSRMSLERRWSTFKWVQALSNWRMSQSHCLVITRKLRWSPKWSWPSSPLLKMLFCQWVCSHSMERKENVSEIMKCYNFAFFLFPTSNNFFFFYSLSLFLLLLLLLFSFYGCTCGIWKFRG